MATGADSTPCAVTCWHCYVSGLASQPPAKGDAAEWAEPDAPLAWPRYVPRSRRHKMALGPVLVCMRVKAFTVFLPLLLLATGTSMAQEAAVSPLMSKPLSNLPGKEGLLIAVEYPPGAADPVHRHNAHAFIYVLEGSVVMQVKGGPEMILTPGQTFYEGPNDLHTVGRNASNTKPAKFLVFLVKDEGDPVLTPEH